MFHNSAKSPFTIAQETSPASGDTHHAAVRVPTPSPTDTQRMAGPTIRPWTHNGACRPVLSWGETTYRACHNGLRYRSSICGSKRCGGSGCALAQCWPSQRCRPRWRADNRLHGLGWPAPVVIGQEQPIPERAGQRGPGGFLGEHRVGGGGLRLHPEPLAHDLKRPTRPRLRRPTNFRRSRAKKKGPIAYRE